MVHHNGFNSDFDGITSPADSFSSLDKLNEYIMMAALIGLLMAAIGYFVHAQLTSAEAEKKGTSVDFAQNRRQSENDNSRSDPEKNTVADKSASAVRVAPDE